MLPVITTLNMTTKNNNAKKANEAVQLVASLAIRVWDDKPVELVKYIRSKKDLPTLAGFLPCLVSMIREQKPHEEDLYDGGRTGNFDCAIYENSNFVSIYFHTMQARTELIGAIKQLLNDLENEIESDFRKSPTSVLLVHHQEVNLMESGMNCMEKH